MSFYATSQKRARVSPLTLLRIVAVSLLGATAVLAVMVGMAAATLLAVGVL